ncbi:hypothetical protein D3C87_1517300 [compost metagenome]
MIDQVTEPRLDLSWLAIGSQWRMNQHMAVGDTEPRALGLMAQDEARAHAFVQAVPALNAQGPIECSAFIGPAAGDDDFASGQFDQALLRCVIQVHSAIGVELKPRAIRQLEGAALTGGGGEIGAPLLPADNVLAQPRGRTHQQDTRQQLHRLAPSQLLGTVLQRVEGHLCAGHGPQIVAQLRVQ